MSAVGRLDDIDIICNYLRRSLWEEMITLTYEVREYSKGHGPGRKGTLDVRAWKPKEKHIPVMCMWTTGLGPPGSSAYAEGYEIEIK